MIFCCLPPSTVKFYTLVLRYDSGVWKAFKEIDLIPSWRWLSGFSKAWSGWKLKTSSSNFDKKNNRINPEVSAKTQCGCKTSLNIEYSRVSFSISNYQRKSHWKKNNFHSFSVIFIAQWIERQISFIIILLHPSIRTTRYYVYDLMMLIWNFMFE